MFCREAVAALRQENGANPEYPRILFFHLGSPKEGNQFLEAEWAEARAVSDPEAGFYDAFSFGRGRIGQIIGFAALRSGFQAWRKGHRLGKPVGDTRRMSGVVAIRDRQLIWRHEYRHGGDHPDFANIPAELERADPR